MTKTKLESEASRHQALTPTDQLRELLDVLEVRVSNIGRITTEQTREILQLMDNATTRLNALQDRGSNVQAEDVRLKSLNAQLQRKSAPFLKALGGPGALHTLRGQRTRASSGWWWFVDDVVAENRRRRLRSLLRLAAIVAVSAVVVVLVYRQFFAPDPALTEKLGHQNAAEMLTAEGAYDDSLAEIALGLAIMPGDPDLLVLRGVTEELKGDQEAAGESYEVALQALDGDRERMLLLRAQTFIRVNEPQRALADAEEVLESVNPESVIGNFMAATAYFLQDDYENTLFHYDEALRLAREQGDSYMEAMIAVQRGQVMQAMIAGPPVGSEATTTP